MMSSSSSSAENVCAATPDIHHHLSMAAVSSAFAELLTFPIDTIKVYQQLEHKHHLPRHLEVGSFHSGMKSGHSHHIHTLGFSHLYKAAREIYQHHGLRGFYRGYKPAVLRASLNNALSATMYKPVRKCLGYDTRDCPFYVKLASGVITGSSTQIIASPTDLLKVALQLIAFVDTDIVRMQADSVRTHPRYHGFFDAMSQIYHKHGMIAFYRGLGPSMLRAGFSVAATLGTYDHCKSVLLKHPFTQRHNITGKDWRLHLLCSMSSGLCATLFACPFDVVKTRYQSQSFESRLYQSSRHCFKTIVKEEGPTVLFQGFLPMYARLGPWQISFFLVFEFLHKEFLGHSF